MFQSLLFKLIQLLFFLFTVFSFIRGLKILLTWWKQKSQYINHYLFWHLHKTKMSFCKLHNPLSRWMTGDLKRAEPIFVCLSVAEITAQSTKPMSLKRPNNFSFRINGPLLVWRRLKLEVQRQESRVAPWFISMELVIELSQKVKHLSKWFNMKLLTECNQMLWSNTSTAQLGNRQSDLALHTNNLDSVSWYQLKGWQP